MWARLSWRRDSPVEAVRQRAARLSRPGPGDATAVAQQAPSRIRRILTTGAETFVSVLAAVLFFLVFVTALTVIFPLGVPIKTVVGSTGPRGAVNRPAQALSGVEGLSGLNQSPATLAVVNNDVKTKRANAIAWTNASSGYALRDGDAVQTTKDGMAHLTFHTGDDFELGRNALMVVRARSEHPTHRTRRSSVLVLEGELWGKVSRGEHDEVGVSVTTPGATAQVRSLDDADGAAEFKVTVQKDKSTTISVYKGVAELGTGPNKVRVAANQFVTIDSASVMEPLQSLPDQPHARAPVRGAQYRYRELPPRVRFKWNPVENADMYRLVVSPDPEFKRIVLDERSTQTSFAFGNLDAGSYYWRVSALRAGAEGAASEPEHLEVLKDARPPGLRVTFPAEVVWDDHCKITGTTDRGSRVFIAGERVKTTRSGRFAHRLRLKRGLNVVVVESIDHIGNATYKSKMIEAKFK